MERSEQLDIVAVNDIKQSLVKQWGDLTEHNLPGLEYGIDYVVLDQNNQVIAATRSKLNQTIDAAINNRDTIVDIEMNGQLLGKLILYNPSNQIWEQYQRAALILFFIVVTFILFFFVTYMIYLDRSIFRPFRKLQSFARHVAGGHLDIPLPMDKSNVFGAFTESFDLMREELEKARENERKANRSKKELVASLSHDIKTPVASIKAVSEVMAIKSKSEDDKRQLAVIEAKADQINTLITNMFTATLEELQELKVEPEEQSSEILYEIMENADFNRRLTAAKIPQCIICVDPLRLTQVVDNIVSNAYKYAETKISIAADIKGQYLEIDFRDYGSGVKDEELPLLFSKFYRAENAQGINGAGLGLYISKYLMEKMSGDILCVNVNPGLLVKVKLLIV